LRAAFGPAIENNCKILQLFLKKCLTNAAKCCRIIKQSLIALSNQDGKKMVAVLQKTKSFQKTKKSA
jgi:hypothetical protein